VSASPEAADRAAEALVEQTVAVVVEAVADLFARRAGLGGTRQQTELAHHARLGAAGADARETGLFGAERVLVDLAVAVVVLGIAELGGGRGGHRIAAALTGDTQHAAEARARPDAGGARDVGVRRVLVDLTVAVVVEPVAELGRGPLEGITGERRPPWQLSMVCRQAPTPQVV
jgi:hypothetical protein